MTEDYTWEDFPDWIASVKKGDAIQIWSDGGCYPNPGPGGWGAILQKGSVRTILRGGGPTTTNNRMEILAALSSIAQLPAGCVVTLYSDSQYVCNGINKWIYGWKRVNWVKKGTQGEIINADLWKEVYATVRKHKVTAQWIRGHNGHPENELCDQIATECRLAIVAALKAEEDAKKSRKTRNKKRS